MEINLLELVLYLSANGKQQKYNTVQILQYQVGDKSLYPVN